MLDYSRFVRSQKYFRFTPLPWRMIAHNEWQENIKKWKKNLW